MNTAIAVVAAAIVFTSPAPVSNSNTNDLMNVSDGNGLYRALRTCPTDAYPFGTKRTADVDRIEANLCGIAIGYIDGVTDVLKDSDKMTFPDGWTNSQTYEVVANYLRDNPGTRHQKSLVLIPRSIEAAYKNRS